MPEITTETTETTDNPTKKDDKPTPTTTHPPTHSQPEVTESSTLGPLGPKDPFLTEQSSLKASRAEHKKQNKIGVMKKGESAGDDPVTGVSQAALKKQSPIPIPSAKYTVFKKGATNPAQDSKRFYNYWNELPGWCKDMSILYVYRDWPKLVEIPEESSEYVYIDKISGSEPLQDDMDLLHRYGAGSYKLMFNDQTPGSYRNICTVYVTDIGVSDLKSHPPTDRRVSDVKQVDMDYPGNKSYLEFLRMAGKLPEQQKGKEIELEMANVALVDKLLERGDRAQDNALEIARAVANKQPVQTKDVSDEAINRAIGIVASGAERANKMVTEAAESAKQMTRSEGSSVKETLDLVSTIIDKFTPKGNQSDPEVAALRAELERMRNDRLKALEEQLTALRAAPQGNTSPSATMKESITAFKEMRDLVEDVVGGGKSNPVEEIGDAAGIPKWLQLSLTYGLPVINNVLSLVMAGRGLTPTAGPPPPIPGMDNMRGSMGMGGPGMAPGSGGTMPMQPGQPNPNIPRPMPSNAPGNAPGLPAPPTQPQPGANPTMERTQNGVPTYGLHPDIADILFEQKTTITQYLSLGEATGEDYADIFIGNYGQPVFETMASFGADALTMTIQSYPPIMSRLNALNISSDRLSKFANEFVNFKPEVEDTDGNLQGEEEDNGTEPGTGSGPGSGPGPTAA